MGLFKKKSPTESKVDEVKPEQSVNAKASSTEKPKQDKVSKRVKALAAKKESEKSAIAKQYGIRVSNPYGYFPEDVDRVLEDLQSQLNTLSKENKFASEKLARIQKERDDAKTELSKLKMQISLMDIPDSSTEEDFQMMSRLNSINPAVGNLVTEVPDQTKFTGKLEPVIADKIESDESPKVPIQETYDNLIQTSKKPKQKQKVSLKTPSQEIKQQRKPKSTFDLEILGGEDQ